MPDLEVYIECDARDCRARSREIWTKEFDGMIWPLTFCSHHHRALESGLTAQGFARLKLQETPAPAATGRGHGRTG